MKLFKNFTLKLAITAVVTGFVASLALSTGVVSAAQIPYDPNGTPTSKTPVFNQFTNVPSGVGDESQFVRLRPSTGDNTSTANNAAYTNALSAACNSGDKFDIHTYIHNGADPNFNNNGTGTAVAHNVAVAQTAALNTTNSNFNFTSTVTASNAASVSDTGTLNCGGKQVKLTLVPGTVKTYSKTLGFNGEADSAVNGSLAIGSRVHGSGDQWACFDDRVIVVYSVVVTELPQPKPVTATCDLFKIDSADDRTVKVTSFKYTATNATYLNTVINWDAGQSNTSTGAITDATKVEGQTHRYSVDGTYLITATVHFSTADNADLAASTANCQQQVVFKAKTPPVVTTTTVTPTPPTTLVNTGAGSVAAMFALASVAGTVAYRFYIARRLV